MSNQVWVAALWIAAVTTFVIAGWRRRSGVSIAGTAAVALAMLIDQFAVPMLAVPAWPGYGLRLLLGGLVVVGLFRRCRTVRPWTVSNPLRWAIGTAITLGVASVLALAAHAAGLDVVVATPPPGPWLVIPIVVAPLVEEPLYRYGLCTTAEPVIGRSATIILSGLMFAALHASYGTLAPLHPIAGCALGWAFVTSRSLVVAMALHAAANMWVLTMGWWIGVSPP